MQPNNQKPPLKMATPSTSETTTPTPPSLHSALSTTTLSKGTVTTTTASQPTPQPERYLYYKKTGRAPNPDAQLKPKSKLDKLLSKFQSPAVKRTNAARERELLEEERRGVKIYSATGVAMGSGQAVGEYL